MMSVFLTLLVLIIIGVPIAFSLGLSSIIGILDTNTIPLTLIPQRMFTMLDSFSLLAIPFFILAGDIMAKGGISKRLVKLADSLVGHIKGGLGMVVILACMLFGAISGSGAAASAAIGSILIPEMTNKGYDREFSGGISAISGPLGIVIPPSIVMVIYAATTNVSVGDLFIAGYIPGLLIGIVLMTLVYIIAKKRNYPSGEKFSWKKVFVSFKEALAGLLLIFIVMGGILSGIFTATEAACVSIIYALFVGFFIFKELKLKDIPGILYNSAITSASIMFCVACTNILAWYITSQQIPDLISEFMLNTFKSKFAILIVINIIFLLLGTILDSTPAVILAVPILLPIAQSIGIDPIHFGIITIVNLAIGQSTPPVGITLFVSSSIAKVKIHEMIKSCLPFWITMFVVLLLITFIPEISLVLMK